MKVIAISFEQENDKNRDFGFIVFFLLSDRRKVEESYKKGCDV